MKNIEEFLSRTIFFSGNFIGEKISSTSYLENIYLDDINFPVRFINAMKQLNIVNLRELLNLDSKNITQIRHCGLKTLTDAKKSIFHYLSNFEKQKVQLSLFPQSFVTEQINFNETTFIPILGKRINILDEKINYLKDIDLVEIDIPIRIQNYFKYKYSNASIYDLIQSNFNDLITIENIGIRSIRQTQKKIENFLLEENTHSTKVANSSLVFEIILKHIESLDNRTKKIVELKWNINSSSTLQAIGDELDITRERVRQITTKFLNSLQQKIKRYREEFLAFLLVKLETEPKPLTIEKLLNSSPKPIPQKYNFLLFYIIAELFPEVAFSTNKANKIIRVKLQKEKKLDMEKYIAHLNSMTLSAFEVSIEYLFRKLGIVKYSKKHLLFKAIFLSKTYFFHNSHNNYVLLRKGNLHQIAEDILLSRKSPISLLELNNIISNIYKMPGKYKSISAMLGNLKNDHKFIQFDRYSIGLQKQFSYNEPIRKSITNECRKIIESFNRQVNAAELFEILSEKFPNIYSKYELVNYLRDDLEIVDVGFFNFTLQKFENESRLKISDIIIEYLRIEKIPKHLKQIYEAIIKERFVRIEGMNNILNSISIIRNYQGGFYGLFENDEENRKHLSSCITYIEKIITYEIFPATSLENLYNFTKMPTIYHDQTIETVHFCNEILVVSSPFHHCEFLVHTNWSNVKKIRCILYNYQSEFFNDELKWLLSDLGITFTSELKSKLLSHSNIVEENGKIKYVKTELYDKDKQDIGDICFEYLNGNDEPIAIEIIQDYLNNEVIDIGSNELKLLLNNDGRFLIIEQKLVMVH